MGYDNSADVAIELIGVRKSFGKQRVLDDVNLTVASGKTTVIVGASGQGKSVIIKHMLGLVRPDEGEVKVFGRNLAKIRKKELNRIRRNNFV